MAWCLWYFVYFFFKGHGLLELHAEVFPGETVPVAPTVLQQAWENRDGAGQMWAVVWGLGCGHTGLRYTIFSPLLFLFGSFYGKVENSNEPNYVK